MALSHAHSVSLPPLPPQHSLPQLPPRHYLMPQLSMSHSLAPQHSMSLLPQHSMPLLPQHSTPLLQTVESRLAGPETSLDIGSLQLQQAAAGKTACCQAGMSSEPCSSEPLSSPAAAAAGVGTCRICFEQDGHQKPEDPSNPLIVPCQCTGSSKYVHRLCLKQWREKKHRSDAFFQCEVCKYRYRYRRLWWSNLLGHQNTLTALFTVTLVACIALLGFAPLTNSFFLGPSSSSSSSSMFGGLGTAVIGLGSSSSSSNSGHDVDPFGGSYIGSHNGRSSIGGAGIGLPGSSFGSSLRGSQPGVQRSDVFYAAALPLHQHTRPQLAAGAPAGITAAAVASISTLPAGPISYLLVHTFNGLLLMALLGLMLSLMLKVGRAFGLPALALLPDPWSSTGACLWCMDVHGGLSPFVHCSSGVGECGIAMLVIMTVLMLMLGLVLAAYLLYGVLWVVVQAGLGKAQQLVENVQQEGDSGRQVHEVKAVKA